MNWKRILTAGILTGALTMNSAAALTVKVDGREVDAGSYGENHTAYVSLRSVAACLGDVDLSWSGGAARAEGTGLSLTARPGALWLEANGRYFYAPGGVRAENGTTMVPAKALAAAMGAQAAWDGDTQTVVLTSGEGVPNEPAYTQEDLYWLSRIISAESQGEPLEGKLAVGTVVLNRVASEEFPDTIYDVIFDRKWGVQFTPVANGAIYWEPTEESVAAAKLVLDGARAAGNSLYFLNPDQTADRWAPNNRPYVTTIGCHWFYA